MHKIGCIADDFTGATDVASVLANQGRNVVVAFGPQDLSRPEFSTADAVVIALKSRTSPVAECVKDIRESAKLLQHWGAEQFYLKYCSTFDSTSQGNIGPSIDTLLTELKLSTAIAAPSYPRNGRTVYQGHLFVGNERLDESPMRDHPLTPMRDSHVRRLLESQTTLPVSNLFLSEVRSGSDTIRAALAPSSPRIVVADAIADEDLRILAQSCEPHVLLTGGAGLALGLGAAPPEHDHKLIGGIPRGGRLIVSGSASAQTRTQIRHARAELPSRKLDLTRLMEGEPLAEELSAWVAEQWQVNPQLPVLIYATDSAEDLKVFPPQMRTNIADRIEHTLAAIAAATLEHGLSALLVAGGETSGRVVQTLGIKSIRIGPELAPGVVWAEATIASVDANTHKTGTALASDQRHDRIAIALKSGNFGGEQLFTEAWEKLQ